MKTVDLRSDTVTMPNEPMLEAMFSAKVGDDVFDEDESITALEEKVAGMFGKESAVFCPSGTMTNQIAIKAHVAPGQEIICDKTAHIYLYEGGGIAAIAGASARLIHGERGKITPDDILNNINDPDDFHCPLTRLVSIENSINKGGGGYYTLEEMQALSNVCRDRGLIFHLDGARIFNAIAEIQCKTEETGALFDSISICMSKGLGAPVGSLLLGDKGFIHQARRNRKQMGGGMRQAGYLAAACSYALENNVERLRDDHRRAKELGSVLKSLPYIDRVNPIQTNMVFFRLSDDIPDHVFLAKLKEQDVLAISLVAQSVRMVTHLDIDDEMIEYTTKVLKGLL
ncbi:MAG TPA: aminotransferase class I/II-fold pyridoxal phosphate-dependent enzyme [Flavobacteriales bacterium]|nr:aminotransferase class I/II-fold pyridoxal phosphate-dependent enzyme [Flavobacteriales bacterium]HIO71921.1 aminotransferase class I/II-fold pyridoxal phosphate-dependent enzyme [Flavobacteriales bacterium]